MDDATKRALFVNSILLANADGAVHPEERRFIRHLIDRAGIGEDEVRAWMREIKSGGPALLPIDDPAAADEALDLLIDLSGADGAVQPDEVQMLLGWAKTVGIPGDDLERRVRARWGDRAAELLPSRAGSASGVADEAAPLAVVVSDGFARLERLREASPDVRIETLSAAELPGGHTAPSHVLFHAQERTEESIRIADRIWRAFPGARIVCVLHRSQAFQISYLLEGKVGRCVVEPVYPGELARLMREADTRRYRPAR